MYNDDSDDNDSDPTPSSPRNRALDRQKSFAASAAAYDVTNDHHEVHMGFTELVMTEEGHENMDLSSVSMGIRERLLGTLSAQRKKRSSIASMKRKYTMRQTTMGSKNNISKMYLQKSVSRTQVVSDNDLEKLGEGNDISDESLRERRQSIDYLPTDTRKTGEGLADEDDDHDPTALMMNIFSPAMIEQFLLTDLQLPNSEDIEGESIDTIEFSLKEGSHDLAIHAKAMPLSHLKWILNKHSDKMKSENRERQKQMNDEAQSAIPLGSHWGMDDSGKKLFRTRMEINSYPLETRRMVTRAELIDGLKKRLGLYAVSQEGVMAHGHTYFINFDGYSQEAVDLAAEEVTTIMESHVEDYAQHVDLHDLMQLLLAVGANSPPITMTARHCVLLGLYPIQCVVTCDKLILIESKSLSKGKNLILETTADEIAKVIRHLIKTKLKQRKLNMNKLDDEEIDSGKQGSRKKRIYFDQICYEAVFITIWKIHTNAIASVQSRALVCHRVYNARAYVSLEDQKQMYMVKMQASKLQAMLEAMSTQFESMLSQDVAMAFMNLSRLKMDDSTYRMTVDKKKTLSTFDNRVTKASHDIELILYAHYLRYAKLEKEAGRIIDMLQNVEQWQTLQSLNTQTKVLVANTYMTVLGCTIAFGGAITGAFGMNLDNAYVDWPAHSFYVVCGFTLLFIGFATKLTIDYLRYYGVIPRQLS